MQQRTIVAACAMIALAACSGSKARPRDASLPSDSTSADLALDVPDRVGPASTDGAGAEVAAAADVPAAAFDVTPADRITDATASDIRSGEDATVLWPGPDAEIVIGDPVVDRDGGPYPPLFIVPGAAIVSHSPLWGAQPDLTARIEQTGDPIFVDLNGDGLRDVVFSDGGMNLSCYLQQKPGSFQSIHGIAMPSNYRFDRVTFGDVNADKLMDMVLVRYPDENGWYHAELSVYLQASDGFRDEPDTRMVPVEAAAAACVRTYSAAVDDMNGDGRPDIVALTAVDDGASAKYGCSYKRGIAQIFTQSPDGSFRVTGELSPRSNDSTCGVCAVSFATGYLNQDGLKDLVVIQNPAGNGSGIPWHGPEVLVYPQAAGSFASTPTQVLKMNQYLRVVELTDVNGDGKLDIQARPGTGSESGAKIERVGAVPGLSGAFLQKSDGTFDAAKALVLDDPPADGTVASARTLALNTWVPAGINQKFDPLGVAVRDFDGDGAGDLLVEGKGLVEGLFRQELGLFATSPDIDVQSLFPALLNAAKQPITITFQPNSSSMGGTTSYNRLAYRVADMDGDGRDDIVVAYSPFAPNLPADPVTGQYPYAGFKANTYTEIQVYRQQAPARRFAVQVQESAVAPQERMLRIRATVRNLSEQPASNLHLRVQAAESPVIFSYTEDMLANRFDEMAAWASRSVTENENLIKGNPLGPDILIPQIGPGETIPLSINVPMALVRYLQAYALFILADPDQSTNLLYRRRFDFIAAQ